MNTTEECLEREYLAMVLGRLQIAIDAARQSLSDADATLVKEQERMWEEARHIVRDIDDALELLSHNRVVDTHHRSNDIARAEYLGLSSMLQSPYFGRIDFQDEEELLRVYIGRRAFADPGAFEFYVYDWRSPIASMFYDFDCGPAHFTSPQGEVRGEMTLKRQFRIANGHIDAMFDANALVQDEILGAILSEQAGHSLKVIAESIQREQNEAIRFLAPRNMLVLGPAGSGKTSVGLHHVAYLLYHNRSRLSSKEIVAISANHAFNEYIAGVLPDLYEADIRREVFADIIAPSVPEGYAVGSYHDQAEYLLCAHSHDARVRWIGELYTLRFVRHLQTFVDALPIEVSDIRLDGETLVSKETFDAFLSDGEAYDFPTRLMRTDHYIRWQCEDHWVRNAKEIRERVQARVANEELDIYTEEEMADYLAERRESAIVEQQAAVRAGNKLQAMNVLRNALRDYSARYGLEESLILEFEKRVERRALQYEDLLILLCVKACMGDIERQEQIRHVLVDEAQDYGPPQHFLLKAIYPRAIYTLLADANQAVLPLAGIADSSVFGEMYPGETQTFHLEKSYRSTGPIGALAASLIAPRQRMTYYDRTGVRPVLRRVNDVTRELTGFLKAHPFEGTTAILVKTRREAQELHARIGRETGAKLLADNDETHADRLLIVPLYLAKGLEFDRVVAILPNGGIGIADERNLLYLLCTRALHELYVLYEGELPAALQESAGLMERLSSKTEVFDE